MDNKLSLFLLYFFISRVCDPLNTIGENTLYEPIKLFFVRFVSFVFIFYFFFRGKKYYKTPLYFVLPLLLSLLISTIVNDSSFHNLFAFAYPILAYTCFFIWVGESKSRFISYIQIVSNYYLIILIVNLGFTIFFPNMFGISYFLGAENRIGYYLLVGFLYNGIKAYLLGKKMQLFIYTALMIINNLLVWSGTAVVAVGLLSAMMFIPILKSFFQKIHFYFLLIAYGVVLFTLVVFSTIGFLDGTFVEQFIVDFLGKNMTFTGRDVLWEETILLIMQKPLLGYGVVDDGNIIQYITKEGNLGTLSAHNQFLQSVYEGGFIVLLIIISSLLYLGKRIDMCAVKSVSRLFKSVVIVLLFMYLTESPNLHYYYEVFVFCCVTLLLLQQEKENLFMYNSFR